MTEGRALTRLVIIDGEVWPAGSVPPAEVAERIRNPLCWAPVEADPVLPWGPEGMPSIGSADTPVVPAEPATNGIANLQEQADGTVSSGVIAATNGSVIGRAETDNPLTDLGPIHEPVEIDQDEPAPVDAGQDETGLVELPEDQEPEPDEAPRELLPEPARSGRGSSESAWRAYAAQFDVEIPEGADRGDIIALLKSRGFIR